MFNVDAKLFEIASRFVSTEEYRYYLQGVFIEPCEAGGVALVATDGHRMFVAYDETGVSAGAYIVQASKDVLRACKKSASLWTGHEGGGQPTEMATVGDDEGSATISGTVSFLDGTFPDWRRVIPTEKGSGFAPVNARYLADFAKAAQDMAKARGERRCFPINVSGSLNAAPCVVSFGQNIPAFGLLMPLHSADESRYCGLAVLDSINAAPQMVAAE